jgi:LPS export ABC transporter protein LptC
VIKRRTYRGIFALLALAVGSWLMTRGTDGPAYSPYEAIDTRLNYALHDFEGYLLDDQGKISLEIFSPVLRKDALSEVGTIERPVVRIQQENEEWYIEAESAIITADREDVALYGSVNMLRTNKMSGQTLEITTSDVMLKVTPRTASTDATVTLVQSGDRLDAVGMNLDMITNSYELLDNVRGHYEVP